MNLFNRVVAGFLTLSLTFYGESYGAPNIISAVPSSVENQSFHLVNNLQISEKAGLIKKRFIADRRSAPVVIHIQDAHGVEEAQQNTKKILSQLVEEYGVGVIFLEGAMGELNADLLRFFEDEAVNVKVAEQLVREGLIGGTELFHLDYTSKARDREVFVHGVEDVDLYRDDIQAYRRVIRAEGVSEEYLSKVKSYLSMLGSHYFNPKLSAFFKEWVFYQDVPDQLLRNLEVLQKYAKEEMELDLLDSFEQIAWPNLVRFAKLKDVESRLDSTKFKEEKEAFMKWLQENKVTEQIINAFEQAFKTGAVKDATFESVRDLVEKFMVTVSGTGFDFEAYPNVALTLGRMVLGSEIQAIEFSAEIEELTNQVLDALAKSEQEKTIIDFYQVYLTQKKVFTLKLVFEEFESMKSSPGELRPSNVVREINQFVQEEVEVNQKKLKGLKIKSPDKLYDEAIKFYRLAQEREEAIYENMTGLMNEQDADAAVLVTGGFHAEGMASFFERGNVSYVQVMPKITSSESVHANKGYHDTMTLSGDMMTRRSYAMTASVNENGGLVTLMDMDPAVAFHYAGVQAAVLSPEFAGASFDNSLDETSWSLASANGNVTFVGLPTDVAEDAALVTIGGQPVPGSQPDTFMTITANGPGVVSGDFLVENASDIEASYTAVGERMESRSKVMQLARDALVTGAERFASAVKLIGRSDKRRRPGNNVVGGEQLEEIVTMSASPLDLEPVPAIESVPAIASVDAASAQQAASDTAQLVSDNVLDAVAAGHQAAEVVYVDDAELLPRETDGFVVTLLEDGAAREVEIELDSQQGIVDQLNELFGDELTASIRNTSYIDVTYSAGTTSSILWTDGITQAPVSGLEEVVDRIAEDRVVVPVRQDDALNYAVVSTTTADEVVDQLEDVYGERVNVSVAGGESNQAEGTVAYTHFSAEGSPAYGFFQATSTSSTRNELSEIAEVIGDFTYPQTITVSASTQPTVMSAAEDVAEGEPGRVISVSPSDGANALQNAIDQAGPGDTVELAAGRYQLNEPLDFGGRERILIRGVSHDAVIDFSGAPIQRIPDRTYFERVTLDGPAHLLGFNANNQWEEAGFRNVKATGELKLDISDSFIRDSDLDQVVLKGNGNTVERSRLGHTKVDGGNNEFWETLFLPKRFIARQATLHFLSGSLDNKLSMVTVSGNNQNTGILFFDNAGATIERSVIGNVKYSIVTQAGASADNVKLSTTVMPTSPTPSTPMRLIHSVYIADPQVSPVTGELGPGSLAISDRFREVRNWGALLFTGQREDPVLLPSQNPLTPAQITRVLPPGTEFDEKVHIITLGDQNESDFELIAGAGVELTLKANPGGQLNRFAGGGFQFIGGPQMFVQNGLLTIQFQMASDSRFDGIFKLELKEIVGQEGDSIQTGNSVQFHLGNGQGGGPAIAGSTFYVQIPLAYLKNLRNPLDLERNPFFLIAIADGDNPGGDYQRGSFSMIAAPQYPTPPDAPVIVSPASDALVKDSTPEFDWDAVDASVLGGDSTYGVEIVQAGRVVHSVNGLTDTEYEVPEADALEDGLFTATVIATNELGLTSESDLTFSIQTTFSKFDVDQNGYEAPSDALKIIARLRDFGSGEYIVGVHGEMHLDVNGDGFLTPQDALQVIARLRDMQNPIIAGAGISAEGEPLAIDIPVGEPIQVNLDQSEATLVSETTLENGDSIAFHRFAVIEGDGDDEDEYFYQVIVTDSLGNNELAGFYMVKGEGTANEVGTPFHAGTDFQLAASDADQVISDDDLDLLVETEKGTEALDLVFTEENFAPELARLESHLAVGYGAGYEFPGLDGGGWNNAHADDAVLTHERLVEFRRPQISSKSGALFELLNLVDRSPEALVGRSDIYDEIFQFLSRPFEIRSLDDAQYYRRVVEQGTKLMAIIDSARAEDDLIALLESSREFLSSRRMTKNDRITDIFAAVGFIAAMQRAENGNSGTQAQRGDRKALLAKIAAKNWNDASGYRRAVNPNHRSNRLGENLEEVMSEYLSDVRLSDLAQSLHDQITVRLETRRRFLQAAGISLVAGPLAWRQLFAQAPNILGTNRQTVLDRNIDVNREDEIIKALTNPDNDAAVRQKAAEDLQSIIHQKVQSGDSVEGAVNGLVEGTKVSDKKLEPVLRDARKRKAKEDEIGSLTAPEAKVMTAILESLVEAKSAAIKPVVEVLKDEKLGFYAQFNFLFYLERLNVKTDVHAAGDYRETLRTLEVPQLLGSIVARESISHQAIERMGAEDPGYVGLKVKAIEVIGAIGVEEGVPSLIESLRDRSADVAAASATHLGVIATNYPRQTFANSWEAEQALFDLWAANQPQAIASPNEIESLQIRNGINTRPQNKVAQAAFDSMGQFHGSFIQEYVMEPLIRIQRMPRLDQYDETDIQDWRRALGRLVEVRHSIHHGDSIPIIQHTLRVLNQVEPYVAKAGNSRGNTVSLTTRSLRGRTGVIARLGQRITQQRKVTAAREARLAREAAEKVKQGDAAPSGERQESRKVGMQAVNYDADMIEQGNPLTEALVVVNQVVLRLRIHPEQYAQQSEEVVVDFDVFTRNDLHQNQTIRLKVEYGEGVPVVEDIVTLPEDIPGFDAEAREALADYLDSLKGQSLSANNDLFSEVATSPLRKEGEPMFGRGLQVIDVEIGTTPGGLSFPKEVLYVYQGAVVQLSSLVNGTSTFDVIDRLSPEGFDKVTVYVNHKIYYGMDALVPYVLVDRPIALVMERLGDEIYLAEGLQDFRFGSGTSYFNDEGHVRIRPNAISHDLSGDSFLQTEGAVQVASSIAGFWRRLERREDSLASSISVLTNAAVRLESREAVAAAVDTSTAEGQFEQALLDGGETDAPEAVLGAAESVAEQTFSRTIPAVGVLAALRMIRERGVNVLASGNHEQVLALINSAFAGQGIADAVNRSDIRQPVHLTLMVDRAVLDAAQDSANRVGFYVLLGALRHPGDRLTLVVQDDLGANATEADWNAHFASVEAFGEQLASTLGANAEQHVVAQVDVQAEDQAGAARQIMQIFGASRDEEIARGVAAMPDILDALPVSTRFARLEQPEVGGDLIHALSTVVLLAREYLEAEAISQDTVDLLAWLEGKGKSLGAYAKAVQAVINAIRADASLSASA